MIFAFSLFLFIFQSREAHELARKGYTWNDDFASKKDPKVLTLPFYRCISACRFHCSKIMATLWQWGYQWARRAPADPPVQAGIRPGIWTLCFFNILKMGSLQVLESRTFGFMSTQHIEGWLWVHPRSTMTTTVSDRLSANVPNEGSSPETSTLILHEIWLLHFTSSADALSLLTIDGISLPASPYNSAPGLFDISCVETVVPYSENKWTAFSTALSKWINASQHAVSLCCRLFPSASGMCSF